ncbi:MAG: TolC family protein [Candidatus Krumholzibacteriota bacterium]
MKNLIPLQEYFKPLVPLLFLGIFLCPGNSLAEAGDQTAFPADPGLTDYLAWAADHNPAVAGAAGRMEALRHGAASAGALPDLRFGWGEMIVPVETRVGPQQRIFSLSQTIPWFGTLGLKETVAGKQADAAAEAVRGHLLKVHHRVRAAWFDLAYLQGEIAIIADNLALARQAEASSRSSYEAGVGSFGDVLAAQIDVEQLAVRLTGLRDRVRPVTARLNLATGLDAGYPTPAAKAATRVNLEFDLPPDPVLWTMLEDNNPDLAELRLEREGRRQGVDLAGKASYPGLTLGVDYIMTGPSAMEGIDDNGKDPVIARLGISIPLWGGRAGAEKKTSAGRLAAAGADLADARLQLNASFENALYDWREAGRNAELYGGVLLDSGRQALEVTAARYRSGQASYVDLVAARKTLLGLELAHLRAVSDRNHALNDLATLLGVPLAELRQRGTGGSNPGRES